MSHRGPVKGPLRSERPGRRFLQGQVEIAVLPLVTIGHCGSRPRRS